MKNYYDTLGVNETASDSEIKSAFRRLAAQHHPDKGGDKNKFQEINEAYDTLKNTQKRQEYDTMRKYGERSFKSGKGFSFNMNDMFNEDVFQDFFSGFGRGDVDFGGPFNSRRNYTKRQQTNKTINVRISLSLKDVMKKSDKTLSIRLPSGRDEIVSVKIPAGCQNNSIFKYKGLGDDSIKNIPRGDLMIQVTVLDSDGYIRKGNDIYTEKTISCFEAIRGTSFRLKTLDDKILNVKIPPGTQPGAVIQLKGQGVPIHDAINIRGSLLIKINILIPQLNKKDLEKIKDL
jgi:curved DNA-binding protein